MKYYFDKRVQLQKQKYDLELKNMEHRYKLDSEYDLDLRTRRIEAYKALWSEHYLLRYFSRPTRITYGDLEALQARLSSWYYDTGGLFLTETSQKIYHMFIQELEYRTRNLSVNKSKELVGESDLEIIRNFGSRFRTNLCKDIGTRDESKNPSLYAVLLISTNKPRYKHGEPVIITVRNIGNRTLEMPDRILGLEIRNLIEYDSYIFLKEDVDKLKPMDEKTFEYKEPLRAGNYIVRISFGSISSIKDFQIEMNKIGSPI
ncbi:MAG TPA: hypothetical protein VFI70_04550 [Nitrososphaeraceae archaeon]|nr:hypothetical protein [Nitrososphaeraceae archaeon]